MQTQWGDIQTHIRDCDACAGHPRVALAIRQRTPAPTGPVQLLLLGIAPPHADAVDVLMTAKSATNNPDDNLRTFITETLSSQWDDLICKGLFLIHAVKCAIVPDEQGYQNPPNPVIDRCIPNHFAAEFEVLRAPRVVAFGHAPLRAVLRHPLVRVPRGVGVSKTLGVLLSDWPDGILCSLGQHAFTLHVAPFPRSSPAKKRAAAILKEAALRAAVVNAAC